MHHWKLCGSKLCPVKGHKDTRVLLLMYISHTWRRFYESAQAIWTRDITTHVYLGFMKRHGDYHVTIPGPS